jgi:hypothetical protein
MVKKAYLVTISLRSRVIAESEEVAVEKAIENFSKEPWSYLTKDNLEEVVEDNECPYGHFDFDEIS